MKVGILSDTHDAHEFVAKAIEIFNTKEVGYVLHAGDLISPFTGRAFSALTNAKFIGVYGNCETEKDLVKEYVGAFGGEIAGDVYTGQIGGKSIYMRHEPLGLDGVIRSGDYDVVIYGHTHRQDIRKVGDVLVVNPGEATGLKSGAPSVAIVDLEDMSCEAVFLD
jgi:hypothetical protein